MKIDLEKGISLKIEGELGKHQSLSVDSLIKIAENLQELILSIAKYDLPVNESLDLSNFKIELVDFQKGSAIPTFAYRQDANPVINADYNIQRDVVAEKLNLLLFISDSGDYSKLKDYFPEANKRNEFVEKLYNFNTSFNNSPVKIYEKNNSQDAYIPKKFKSGVKTSLLVKVEKQVEEKTEENAFAYVKVIKTGTKSKTKIEEVINSNLNSLSYSPSIIKANGKEYVLNFPLRSLLEKEENYYVINNEVLDIIATGETHQEAEFNFNEEFDFLYNRLNELSDNQLTNRLLKVKQAINNYIKNIN